MQAVPHGGLATSMPVIRSDKRSVATEFNEKLTVWLIAN